MNVCIYNYICVYIFPVAVSVPSCLECSAFIVAQRCFPSISCSSMQRRAVWDRYRASISASDCYRWISCCHCSFGLIEIDSLPSLERLAV